MQLRHRRIVQLIGCLRRDADLKRAFSVQSCPFIGNDLKCCDSGIVGNRIHPDICIHHVRHRLLVNVRARGVIDAIALRWSDAFAQPNIKLRAAVRCGEHIPVANLRQRIIHRQAGIFLGSFICNFQQIVKGASLLDKQTLLAPVVGAFRGDELFGVDRLGGDDGGVRVRRIHSTLGLMMMGMFMSKTIWKTAETTKLCIKFQTFASIHRSCSWNNLNLLIIPKSVHRKAYPTQGATGLRNGRNR